MVKKAKREALSVNRLINEVLVKQLSIPLRQIVNDSTFSSYLGSQRPDILISEFSELFETLRFALSNLSGSISIIIF